MGYGVGFGRAPRGASALGVPDNSAPTDEYKSQFGGGGTNESTSPGRMAVNSLPARRIGRLLRAAWLIGAFAHGTRAVGVALL